ncbi:OmpA family protein [Spirosoma sp. KNUC1025]|uniref:OmpA family protein n=1 Tax=Spirosoma sp. KNUC1025 TaxID=2894082 RepID=UPI0038674D78|nr:OmpA family protein [Spirosoma sp. KNUC1025]
MSGRLLLVIFCVVPILGLILSQVIYPSTVDLPESPSMAASISTSRGAPMLTISIRLIDAETDTVVANGQVVATDETNGQLFAVVPDSLGFKLSATPGTTLTIQASAPAYLPAKTRISNLALSQRVIIKLIHTRPSILTIKAFATNISQPLSPATAVITSMNTGKSEQFALTNGRLQRSFTKPDKLEITVGSPGYTSASRQLTIDVPPLGNRYEFDAELDSVVTSLPIRPLDAQLPMLTSSIASVSAVTTKSFGVIEKGKTIRLNKIFFDQSSPVLRPESYTELDQLYSVLTQYPSLRIEIRGYTDNQGDFDLNTQLSRERCQAIVDYLSKKGFAETD